MPTMQAAIIRSYGKPEELRLEEVPRPTCGADQVLLRLRAAGINPKDCFIRKGNFRLLTGTHFPLILGSDFAGEVVEVGANVKNVTPGDEVYGMLTSRTRGTYGQYVTVKPGEFAPRPPSLSWAEAAAVPLAALTALQSLRDLGGITPTSRVCINGASGGVGTFALQIAKAWGAHTTAVCSHRNTELCKELGADEIFDYTKDDIPGLPRRFDIFFDVFGNLPFPKVKQRLTPRGVHISTIPNPENFLWTLRTSILTHKKARVILVRPKTADLELLSSMVEEGVLRPLIDETYPLAQAAKAHAHVQSKRTRGKVVLLIDD